MMHARLCLDFQVSGIGVPIRQLDRVIQGVFRIEIVVGDLQFAVVKLALFGQNIVNGGATVTDERLLLQKLF